MCAIRLSAWRPKREVRSLPQRHGEEQPATAERCTTCAWARTPRLTISTPTSATVATAHKRQRDGELPRACLARKGATTGHRWSRDGAAACGHDGSHWDGGRTKRAPGEPSLRLHGTHPRRKQAPHRRRQPRREAVVVPRWPRGRQRGSVKLPRFARVLSSARIEGGAQLVGFRWWLSAGWESPPRDASCLMWVYASCSGAASGGVSAVSDAASDT
jgi:hypothetical protein